MSEPKPSDCPECGTTYVPDAAFCAQCGTPRATYEPATAHEPKSDDASDGAGSSLGFELTAETEAPSAPEVATAPEKEAPAIELTETPPPPPEPEVVDEAVGPSDGTTVRMQLADVVSAWEEDGVDVEALGMTGSSSESSAADVASGAGGGMRRFLLAGLIVVLIIAAIVVILGS